MLKRRQSSTGPVSNAHESGAPDAAGSERRGVRGGSAGFTLIELLIVAGLSVTVVVAMAAAYVGTVKSWRGTAALADVQRDASLAVEVISREVRPGSRISISDSDSLSVFLQTDTGDSLIAAFCLDDSSNLVDMEGRILASGVDSLKFTSTDAKTLNVDIWISNDVGTPNSTVDDQAVLMSTTAVCRN